MAAADSSQAPTAATSSASAEDRVMFRWVALHDLRRWLPIIIAPPLVDQAVRLQPAQSESEKPSTWLGCYCHENFETARGRLFKYLSKALHLSPVTKCRACHASAFLLHRILNVCPILRHEISLCHQSVSRCLVFVQWHGLLLLRCLVFSRG